MNTLPPPCGGSRPKKRLRKAGKPHPPSLEAQLNAEQIAFVEAEVYASLALKAGAGSGKTEVLARRIRRLLREGASVLVFSHANKTVDEIKRRLRGHALDVEVLTMHKYCISLMHRAGRAVPHSMDAVMLEAADAFEAGLLDAFQSHVIVDEANDLSAAQNRIIYALWHGGHHVTLVGDMMQSIYGFQGSSPTFFKRFEELLPPACRFQLRTNFRSRNSRLVELANAVACDDIAAGTAVCMLPCPDAAPGAKPALTPFCGGAELHAACLAHIRQLRAQRADGEAESVMVLAHDNCALGALHHYLMVHRVEAALYDSKRSEEFRRVPERLKHGGVVQLLTVHGAKGGEADHVLLLTGHDRGDAQEAEGDEGSESRRMLYVACTRAKLTLRVFYGDAGSDRPRQPCRWLSSAWHLLEAAAAQKFSSAARSYARKGRAELCVTTLMQENGAEGHYDYFASADDAAHAQLFCDEILDLEDTDDAGEPIEKQAPRAYELGLEKFMGLLFENHALNVFDRGRLTQLATDLLARASCLAVNQVAWSFFHSDAGRQWWRQQGWAALLHLHEECLGESHTDCGEIYLQLPRDVQSSFTSALNSAKEKLEGFAPLRAHLCARLAKERARLLRAPAAGVPDFRLFFRPWYDHWDKSHKERLRPTLAAAFEAAVRVAEGSEAAQDLCLFTALGLCWEPEIKKKDQPTAWQPLLHLAQLPTSKVQLRPEDLALSAKACAQIQHDGARVVALLGAVQGLQTGNRVAFACRADYGDQDLSARGVVLGRCDATFARGPLEIKAVKLRLGVEHAAQALWYCCATASAHAFLWDVYRRRLLVWRAPDRPAEYLQACLSAYLKYNAPPDAPKKIWPQRVTLGP